MNTKHAIVSLGIACAAFLGGSGCTNPIAPITTPIEVIPLKVGNEWNYELANYLPIFNDTLYRSFTTQIARDTLIKGKRHFVKDIIATGGIFISNIVTNLTDGQYLWNGSQYMLINKYPVHLGDKYQRVLIDFQSLPIDTLDIEVIDLNKTATVKAGTFQCYTEQYHWGSFRYQTFIAAGYGEIQELVFDSTNTLVARTQLTSYTIQK